MRDLLIPLFIAAFCMSGCYHVHMQHGNRDVITFKEELCSGAAAEQLAPKHYPYQATSRWKHDCHCNVPVQHDDRDVVTFNEELQPPRNGGVGQMAAGSNGRGPRAGGSFIVEDSGCTGLYCVNASVLRVCWIAPDRQR